MSDYSKKLLTKAINNMDALLSEFSMARKAITKDDSCLFRAVSEKLFFTQHHHQAVRESCLQYLLRHQEEYQPFIAETIGSRVDNIRDGKTRAGHLEMVIMSRMYSLDFVLFHTPSLKHYPLTDRFYNQIFLCYVNDNHYDLVYAKSFLQTAAICQAIVYDVLYREVFGLSSELDEAVIFLELQKPLSRDSGCLDCAPSQVLNTVGEDKVDILKKLGGMTSPPVPYRIAKALHPALYRNVELDIVQEERREARSSSITTKKGLAPGDKCQVLLEDKGDHSAHAYNAHIQKIDDLTQTVVAFIEELGVIQSVPADCVRPLPLAISHLDESTILPVADLNLSPYSKKNRRRKGGLANNLFGRQFTPPKNFERTQKPKESPPPRVGTPTLYSALSPRHVPSSGTAPNSSHINTECNTFTQSHYPTNIGYQEIYSDASYSPSTTPINIYPGEVITDVNNNSYNYNNNNFSNNYNGSNCSFSPVYQDKNIPYVPVAYSGLDCHSPNNLSPSAPLTPHHAPLSHAPLNHAPLGHALDPLAPPTYCVMSGQAPAYYMPMVAVPYSNTMGPVNLGWGPSQDTAGKDLPLSDANTLRFFFNLGVEYYRMSQCGPSLQPGVVYPDGQHGPVLMDTTYSGVLTSDLPRDLPHGQPMEPRAWTGGNQQQQVMYMVSPPYPPTYQQPAGVTLLPPTCPVPVQ